MSVRKIVFMSNSGMPDWGKPEVVIETYHETTSTNFISN